MRTLLRVLLIRRGSFVPNEVLIEALWPAHPPVDPVGNLKVLVNRARGALGSKDLIRTGPAGYSFAVSADCRVDAEEFLELLDRGSRELNSGRCLVAHAFLEQAIELWKGEPLSEDRYQDWAQEYRRRLTGSYLEALEAGSSAARAAGLPASAVRFARLAAEREPLREASHLLLAEALGASGDVAGGLQVVQDFRIRIADELGLDLSPAAAALQVRLLNLETVGRETVRTDPDVSSLGPLPFIGRSAPLEELLGLLSGGSSAIVAVFGPGGSGKTRLLEELASRITRRVVPARTYLAEREDSWSVAASLMRSVLAAFPDSAHAIPARAAGALADLVPQLEELRSVTAARANQESRRALAMQGAVRLMESAAALGAVFVVDDLQWADATSLSILGLLARRVPGLSLVVTARPSEEGVGTDQVDQFLGQLPNPAVRMDLAGMSLEDIESLVADPVLAGLMQQGTDGNPFALTQLLRTLWEQGMVVRQEDGRWGLSHPDALAAAREAIHLGERRRLMERIGSLPAGERRILELLSLLGREAPTPLLSAAMEVESDRLLDDLEVLSARELVQLGKQGWGLIHHLLSEAIAGELRPAKRVRLHTALAETLARSDADPAEIARHLVGARDPVAAAAAFAAGAKLRLDRFATEEAETMANEGLANQPAGAVLAELLEIRSEALFRRGELDQARADLRAAIQARPEGPKRAFTLSRLAMLTSGAKDYVHALELTELALAEAGNDPEAKAEALVHAANFDINLGRYEIAETRHEEAMTLFQQAGQSTGIARILENRAFAAFVRGDFIAAERLLDRVAHLFEDAGELLRVANPRCARGLVLAWMNRAAEGMADMDDALELSRLVGNIELEGHVLWFRSQVLCALGKVEEAQANAEETLRIATRMGHRELRVTGLIGLGDAVRQQGRLGEAESILRHAMELSVGIPIFEDAAAVRLAPVLLEQGDLASAEQYLEQVLSGPAVSHCEARHWLAEIAFKRRDPDAVRIAEEALALAEQAGHYASAVKLRELLRSSGG